MLSPQEWLVKFMQAKANRLRGHGLEFEALYFSESDAETLRDLENREAKKVVKTIRREIVENGAEGLTEDACPFCITCNLFCASCPYGERHGICAEGFANDYGLITHYIDTDSVFPNNFYIKLIKELDNE